MSCDRTPPTTAAASHESNGTAPDEQPRQAVLDTLVRLARRVVPASLDVSVTVVRGEHPVTAASSGQLALALDGRQYRQRHGPCLHAATTGGRIGTERRYLVLHKARETANTVTR